MNIISIAALALFLAVVGYFLRARFAAFIAGFFILFPLIYRSVDIAILDLFGPFYTRELGAFVGGNMAAPVFIYAALSFLVPLVLLFPDSPKKLVSMDRAPLGWTSYHERLAHMGFAAGMAVLAALLINLVLVGTIPILEGMDRTLYARSAGPIHTIAYELNFLINFVFGAFTILPRLAGRGYDLRFAGLALALTAYWVVTGNRFSVFFVLVSFYLMPTALVIMARASGRIGPLGAGMAGQRLFASATARVLASVFAGVMVGGLLFNSYYNVRDYREPLFEMQERIVVQPVHLWATAWDRVDFGEVSDPVNAHAVREILDPIDRERNSTIQYLMTKELGYFRAAELTRIGQAYNGGYPEVHFELLGAYLPFLTLPLAGFTAAWLLVQCLVLLSRGLVLTSILGVYLFYGASLHYTGGMVTFLLAPTYWLKIAAFVGCWMLEPGWIRASALRMSQAARPMFWRVPQAAQAEPHIR